MECGGISIFRIADGKIVEQVSYADDLGVWLQFGAVLPENILAFRHRTWRSAGRTPKVPPALSGFLKRM